MAILTLILVTAGAIGVILFLLKFFLTRGIRRIETVINTAITDATDIANGQALPERWRDEVTRTVRHYPAARRDEKAKRLALRRIDRLIAQVERGTVFQEDARKLACERLRTTRDRWVMLSWPDIAAEAAFSSSEPSKEENA